MVSRAQVNQLGRNVAGIPLSTKIHKACPQRILIPIQRMILNPACARKLQDSVASTDHIRVLDMDRLEQSMMGSLSATAIGGLELRLSYLFNIL
jgi:mRNA-degrading endonuclease toxin of MazEF toxin-antitoxin module